MGEKENMRVVGMRKKKRERERDRYLFCALKQVPSSAENTYINVKYKI